MKGLFVDNFAGGGGASTGIEVAIGRSVDIAINHDPDAIAMHKVNHPTTKHFCENVWDVDPEKECAGREITLAWFSPDCKHFSKAKGGKPLDKNIRGLAWVTLRWAYLVRPKVIMLENVAEIQTWGPLMPKVDPKTGRMYKYEISEEYPTEKRIVLAEEGENVAPALQVLVPDPERAGETFDGFILALTTGILSAHPAFSEMCEALGIEQTSDMAKALEKGLGYDLEYNLLKSCDYGAPTTRTRFYMIARCDGRPIVWPQATHADKNSAAVKSGKKLPYRTAAECIDWSIPAQSIFERKKPLAENTLKRIARGIQKFVIDNPEPFIVTVNHSGDCFRGQSVNAPIGYGEREGQEPRVNSVEEPLGTIVSSGKHYLCTPTLIQYHSETAENEVRGQRVDEPMMTVDTSPRYALSVAHIMKNYAGGYTGAGSAPDKPLDTVTAKDHNSLVTAHIMTMRNHMDGQRADQPLSTISCSGAHHAEVQAFLLKYYSGSGGKAKSLDTPLDAITTKDRFAIVTIHGEEYIITDIKMRMLQPRELFKAQGFPDDYVIDRDAEGKPYPKSKQVARCGNAVTPQVPTALVRANLPEECV